MTMSQALGKHAIESAHRAGEKTGKFRGMIFQDSDVAKWLEALPIASWLNLILNLRQEA